MHANAIEIFHFEEDDISVGNSFDSEDEANLQFGRLKISVVARVSVFLFNASEALSSLLYCVLFACAG